MAKHYTVLGIQITSLVFIYLLYHLFLFRLSHLAHDGKRNSRVLSRIQKQSHGETLYYFRNTNNVLGLYLFIISCSYVLRYISLRMVSEKIVCEYKSSLMVKHYTIPGIQTTSVFTLFIFYFIYSCLVRTHVGKRNKINNCES